MAEVQGGKQRERQGEEEEESEEGEEKVGVSSSVLHESPRQLSPTVSYLTGHTVLEPIRIDLSIYADKRHVQVIKKCQ